MGSRSANTEKNSENKADPFQGMSENVDSSEEHNSSKSLIPRFEPADVLILNIKELRTKRKVSESCSWQVLFQFHGLDGKIPKHLISLDEAYLRRCLEVMHISALRATSSNLLSKKRILSNNMGSRKISNGSIYSSTTSEYPLAAGTEAVVISTMGDPILGSITDSKSMMNILSSPLLQQFSALDSYVDTGRASLPDDKEREYSDLECSPGGSTVSSSHKVSKEMVTGAQGCETRPVHKRLVSVSSTNSTFSDHSSTATSNFVCQGMLHCTWKDGFPQYIFSIDDQREVYAANLFKIDSPDDKILDYVYIFYSRAGGRLEHEIRGNDVHIVGKMRVSTSITLCPNNSDIMETQFVLFGSSDNYLRETQTSTRTVRKNKALTKKVADVFRTSHSHKQRTSSKFSGTSAILENSSWEPSEELHDNFDPGGLILTENDFLPNLELAAIIVKDHLSRNCKKAETGGWGLKFLKNSGIRKASTSEETSMPSESCARESGECSTSMDILVPAGFHGGPRTRNGGPSSLTDRWSSGGHCDCGGWDIGCPLTLLNPRPSRTDVSPQADISGECKTYDLFVQGSKQSIPTMKMTNIHDGLYYVHFQSVLSALQAFSIAASIIHTNSPTLRPKVYRN